MPDSPASFAPAPAAPDSTATAAIAQLAELLPGPKPGLKTSEFWLSAVVIAFSIAGSLTDILPPWLGAIIGTISAALFHDQRAEAKDNHSSRVADLLSEIGEILGEIALEELKTRPALGTATNAAAGAQPAAPGIAAAIPPASPQPSALSPQPSASPEVIQPGDPRFGAALAGGNARPLSTTRSGFIRPRTLAWLILLSFALALLPLIFAGCAYTRVADPRTGKTILFTEADGANVDATAPGIHFHADTLNHSSATTAGGVAFASGTTAVGGAATGVILGAGTSGLFTKGVTTVKSIAVPTAAVAAPLVAKPPAPKATPAPATPLPSALSPQPSALH